MKRAKPKRPWNFGAGPAQLPDAVLTRMQDELWDWHGCGTSVLEIGHRSPEFYALIEDTLARFRTVMAVPDDYHVMILHGGARAIASMLPFNLCGEKKQADYAVTGYWSETALSFAQPHCDAKSIFTMPEGGASIPDVSTWQVRKDSAYLHYTTNETLSGLQFKSVPEVSIPLVADMTSDIVAYPVDVSKFGMIYASLQKNLGVAGAAVVIVRKDLCAHAWPTTPPVFHFAAQAELHSSGNTPPMFAMYAANLMLQWLEAQGGVAEVAKRNQQKSALLWAAIDAYPNLYLQSAEPAFRSTVTHPFKLPTSELETQFLEEATSAGLLNMRGHKAAGGIRISLYNAMPLEGVQALVDFIQAFGQQHA